MLRSMYSGISGLKNFQTKLDVIGNNIANVNTHGFKKGRTIFKDLISQSVAGASAPGDNRGGVNPRQVGLGSQLAAIDTLHSPGSTQFTGQTLDLAITGDGFFQVMDGNEVMYTRAGNFYMDQNGDLVDGDGRYVVGDDGIINIPLSASSMSIGQDGTVYFVDLPEGAEAAIAAAERRFGPIETSFKAAEKALNDAKDKAEAADKAFKAADKAVEKAKATIDKAKDAWDAAEAVVIANPGDAVAVADALVAKGVHGAAVTAKGPLDTVRTNAENARTAADKVLTDTGAADVTPAYNAAKLAYDPAKVAFDKVLEANKATLQEAGQIEMATFSNPGGLEKTGGNLFRTSANSGAAETGVALQQGFGKIESGTLEMSNVDLAEEFTEMIIAQRGFQANTRIITTSDEILQELVNLKR
ncbi:flagellar hook-basal body complex protein [Sporosarcina siberiensis]|uniref:Flagellar hook protein FlgE n=1 Tax=Sporosarcina siberiensis TaxID=1365606 RepID=A0ABW4SGR0_9BACL